MISIRYFISDILFQEKILPQGIDHVGAIELRITSIATFQWEKAIGIPENLEYIVGDRTFTHVRECECQEI